MIVCESHVSPVKKIQCWQSNSMSCRKYNKKLDRDNGRHIKIINTARQTVTKKGSENKRITPTLYLDTTENIEQR